MGEWKLRATPRSSRRTRGPECGRDCHVCYASLNRGQKSDSDDTHRYGWRCRADWVWTDRFSRSPRRQRHGYFVRSHRRRGQTIGNAQTGQPRRDPYRCPLESSRSGVPGATVERDKSCGSKLGIDLQLLEARTPNDFDAAFSAIRGTRTLFILIDPLFITHYRTLAELSVKRRLIAIFGYSTFADAGGLMAYGPNYSDLYKHTATYVDKILKGAKPADLPVNNRSSSSLS